MTYGTRKCLECGHVFEAQRPSQVCCSAKCQDARSRRSKAASAREGVLRTRRDLAEAKERVELLERELRNCKRVVIQARDEANALCAKIKTLETENANLREKGCPGREAELVAENKRLAADLEQLKERAIIVNVCSRLHLRQTSDLPCGLRRECFVPDQCTHVPEGRTYLMLRAAETRQIKKAASPGYKPSHGLDL